MQPVSAAAPNLSQTEQLPAYDGSLVALPAWLRLLARCAHLFPPEVAFFLLTGAAAAGPKTAVLSVKQASMLSESLMGSLNYGVLNPPPIGDKFDNAYDTFQQLPNNPHGLAAAPTMSAALKEQFLIAPARILAVDLQLCNMLLALITASGRKRHYYVQAGSSGVKLLNILISDSKKGASAFTQSVENRDTKYFLKQALDMKLTCVSQEEFNHIRDLVEDYNGRLPSGEQMTSTQLCDHFLDLLSALCSDRLDSALATDMATNKVSYGDLPATLEAVDRVLTNLVADNRRKAAHAARAFQAAPPAEGANGTSNKRNGGRDPSRVRIPCPLCAKPGHIESQCFQNKNADEDTLRRAPRGTPAHAEWQRRKPSKAAASTTATHSLASSTTEIEELFASALANGGTTPITYGFDVPGRAALATAVDDPGWDRTPVLPTPSPSSPHAVPTTHHTRWIQENLVALAPSTIACSSAADVECEECEGPTNPPAKTDGSPVFCC